jgi:hypothetical protein
MATTYRFDRQEVLAGAESDTRGLLARKARARIVPRAIQLPCDIGLFSDDADQLDLVDWLTTQSEH